MNKIHLLALSFLIGITPIVSADKAPHQMSMKEMLDKIPPMKGKTPVQWRVIWTGNASKEARISWSTAEKTKKNIVHYGTVDKKRNIKNYPLHKNCQVNGQYTLDPSEESLSAAYYHHADLEKLKADTQYYFVLESDGERSPRFYFKTAPKKGTKFSLIVGGDSRSGHKARCRMNLFMAQQVKRFPEHLALIHGGDYVVHGNKYAQWRLWLSHHELTTNKDGRVLPIIPAKGNHDAGVLYHEAFNIPVVGKKEMAKQPGSCHVVTLGKDVAIVTLNTNRSAAHQVEWLEEQLKRLRPKTKWLLTQYHRPFYPAVKGPGAHGKVFVPLFEKYDVDLACESDGHCIKRTVPIRDDKEDPTGVTYIGEGGLGVGQYHPKVDRWYLAKGAVSRGHHTMSLKFRSKKLQITVNRLEGEIFDTHTLNRRKK